jgi:CubicO group peptidase (beta-lactamase class C family)
VPTIIQVLDGVPPANSAPVRVERVPGTAYSYSGGGYTVLQLLLEDVTGRPLPKLVAEYIFRPAGMIHSTFCPPCRDSSTSLTSMGHSVDRTGTLSAFKGYAFLPGGSTCCEMWTTASDLARFIVAVQKALRGDPGSILSRETAQAMITPIKGGPAGLGFFIQREEKAVYFDHSGGNVGFSAYFIGNAKGGCGYAVTINSDSSSSLTSELTLAVAAAYGWEGIKPLVFKDAAALLDDIKRRRLEMPGDPRISEGGLNRLGYRLLRDGNSDAAIGVFRLNMEFNPRSANCCDSLAEACEGTGDKANALKYYRQALDLLDRFPEPNKEYERNRKATAEKILMLEQKQSGVLGTGQLHK